MFADWGFQNRTTALRVSAPGRFEYRSVDSAVNPYLSLAALIKAMDDGIKRKIDPGDPEERNIYEAMEAGKEVKRIPMTFGDALDALDADEVIQSAMPGEMFKVFRHYKRDEWERYCATVSDWDVEGVPRHPPLARAHDERRPHMCGIAGIIYRYGAHDIGEDMIAMLQSMKHRGPDSTGYALYGQPREPRRDALQAGRRQRPARLRVPGPAASTATRSRRGSARRRDDRSVEAETEYAFRVRSSYDGDLKTLVDFVEDVPTREVLSLGTRSRS